jgi:hypothetical protein
MKFTAKLETSFSPFRSLLVANSLLDLLFVNELRPTPLTDYIRQ